MTWTVPIEIVRRLTSAHSLVLLIRAQMQGAVFEREIPIVERCGRYWAQVRFVVPVDGKRELLVALEVRPEKAAA